MTGYDNYWIDAYKKLNSYMLVLLVFLLLGYGYYFENLLNAFVGVVLVVASYVLYLMYSSNKYVYAFLLLMSFISISLIVKDVIYWYFLLLIWFFIEYRYVVKYAGLFFMFLLYFGAISYILLFLTLYIVSFVMGAYGVVYSLGVIFVVYAAISFPIIAFSLYGLYYVMVKYFLNQSEKNIPYVHLLIYAISFSILFSIFIIGVVWLL